jgi:hypothetical protein
MFTRESVLASDWRRERLENLSGCETFTESRQETSLNARGASLSY